MSDTANLPVDVRIWPTARYLSIHAESVQDSDRLWSQASHKLLWKKSWTKVLDWKPPFARWFVDGQLNASENAVDRHMHSGHKDKVAYYWEGEPGDRRVITYSDLYRAINRFASVREQLGVRKGDVVAIYMPLVPEFP